MKFQRAANDTEQWKESQSKTATKISQPDSVFQPKRKKIREKIGAEIWTFFGHFLSPGPLPTVFFSMAYRIPNIS